MRFVAPEYKHFLKAVLQFLKKYCKRYCNFYPLNVDLTPFLAKGTAVLQFFTKNLYFKKKIFSFFLTIIFVWWNFFFFYIREKHIFLQYCSTTVYKWRIYGNKTVLQKVLHGTAILICSTVLFLIKS